VKLLVTSRTRLNLAAEWLLDLAGLPFPAIGDHSNARAYPAVELFVRRSQRVRPELGLDASTGDAIARICRLTEGLPLAIELAAAWTRNLTPAQIADELARDVALLESTAYDVPERHRSMTAVFDRSWELLTGAEQLALAQLSIFRGGFDLEAARAVARVSAPLLQALVDRSLLRVDETGRFGMHPLVQQFAGGRLAQRPEANAAASRHAQHYATLTGQREHEFHGDQDRLALQWMQREFDNIRAAWDWGVRQADTALIEPFLESFLYFFDIQGRYRECAELTGQALHALQAQAGQPDQAFGLGRVMALHAAFGFRVGEFDLAREVAEQALVLLEPQRPHRDVGHGRLYLGAAWYGLGDLARAVQWFLAAVSAYREAGHEWGIGAALDNAGYLEFLRGNAAEAEAHLKGSLEVARRTGSRYLLTGVYDHLAALTAAQSRNAEALDYVASCRKVLEEMDRPYIVSSLSLSLSQIAMQAGDLAAAEDHIHRALAVARDTGNQYDLMHFLLQLGAVTIARGDYPAALAAYREAAALGLEIHADSLMVDVIAGLAERAWAMDNKSLAGTLFRFAQGHPSASQETISRAAGRLAELPRRPAAPSGPNDVDEALALGLRAD
jgi:predicted ATPase